MNTTLPPSRDLPPRRHAEIRYTVVTSAEDKPPRRLLTPLVAAAAALAVVGLVAYLVPWGQQDSVAPATQPPGETTVAQQTTETTTETTVAGVAPDEAAAIEQGCAESAGVDGKFTLTQLLTDDAGRMALVYSDERVLTCTIGYGPMEYNSGFSGLLPFTGPISFDTNGGATGGDVPGGKAVYAGLHGFQFVAGRVAPEVAKVVYLQDGTSVDAVIANGSFLARIVHPTTWAIPENHAPPVVRAYDKNGTLLAEVGP
jgi:hypothetical protein